MYQQVEANINVYNSKSNKLLLLLCTLYVTALLASVIVIYKQVAIASFILPGSTLIYCLTYSITDIIAETYGYAIVRQLIWISLICELLFSSAIVAIINTPSPAGWSHEQAYQYVTGALLQVFFASLIGSLSSAFLNAYLISKWKILIKGKLFWLRSLGSSLIGELMLTILVGAIVWYGKTDLITFSNMTISTFMFKLFCTILFITPTVIAVNLIKKYGKMDVYDISTNFNPFKF